MKEQTPTTCNRAQAQSTYNYYEIRTDKNAFDQSLHKADDLEISVMQWIHEKSFDAPHFSDYWNSAHKMYLIERGISGNISHFNPIQPGELRDFLKAEQLTAKGKDHPFVTTLLRAAEKAVYNSAIRCREYHYPKSPQLRIELIFK